MSPNETLFLESTPKLIKDDISNSSFMQFQIWDFPGQLIVDLEDPSLDLEQLFGGCGALIFVIDAQDDYMDALKKLNDTVYHAHKVSSSIKFEVFIHKVDGLSDDHKIETQRDIHQRANDELIERGMDAVHLRYRFFQALKNSDDVIIAVFISRASTIIQYSKRSAKSSRN